ncbi:MAG: metallophosphoesterase, partial [Candidatus Kapaibacteriota bacterium]
MRSVLLLLLISTTIASAQTFTIILGRPTDRSVTASVRFDRDVTVAIEHGTTSGTYSASTSSHVTEAGVPVEIDLLDLQPNTRYYYRLRYQRSGGSLNEYSDEYTVHTQRAPGSTFRFAIQADEHLYDKKGIRSLYQISLANVALDKPDFMLSLGDTFGDDHTPDETTSLDMDSLHRDYLQYLGSVCHSTPFYFCLGNHEGENGYYLKQDPPNNIAVYGTMWRKYYYPNPYPNHFYSGNTVEEGYNMGLPENYYAWTWGDALFVVLDVYRHCDVNEKPQGWDWTLGEKQYQ